MRDGLLQPAEFADCMLLQTNQVKTYNYSHDLSCSTTDQFGSKSNSVPAPWCTDGSNHFLEMVKLLQHLPESIKSLVWPVVQRNSYWGHHENVLLAMLADLSSRNRQIAIDRIIAIRNASDTSEQTLRAFQVPKINQEAMQLIDLLPSVGDCTT